MRKTMLLRLVMSVVCLVAVKTAGAAEETGQSVSYSQAPLLAKAERRNTLTMSKRAAPPAPMSSIAPPESAIWPSSYAGADHYAVSTKDPAAPIDNPGKNRIAPIPFNASGESEADDGNMKDNDNRTDNGWNNIELDEKSDAGKEATATDAPKRKGLWFRKKVRERRIAEDEREQADRAETVAEEENRQSISTTADPHAEPPVGVAAKTDPATKTSGEPPRMTKEKAPAIESGALAQTGEGQRESWRQPSSLPPTPAEIEQYRQRLELRLLERYNNLPDHAGQVAKVSVVLSKPLVPSLDGTRIRAEFDQLVYDSWGKRIPALENEYYVVVFGSGGVREVRSDPSIRVGLDMEKVYSERAPLTADPLRKVPDDAAFRPAPRAKMPEWWRPEFRD